MIFAAVCGWIRNLTEPAMTEPWSTMNLPVTQDAIVYASSSTELKAVFRDEKAKVSTAIDLAILKADWKQLLKKTVKMEATVYDLENTGVILAVR